MRREKEGGHGHRPCEETRDPGSAPVRRNAVAEVDEQHPGLEYARTQRSKKGGGTSERGPRRRGVWQEIVSHRVDRNDAWCLGLRRLNGAGSGKTQNGVRTSLSGHHTTAERRCGGRGTGAVKATGSYEGSSAVEGTSGRHEPSAFTSRWSRRPWRLPHAGNVREQLTRARATEGRAKALPTFHGRGGGDRGVRGMIGSRRRGKKTPTLFLHAPETGAGGKGQKQAARVSLRSAEAFSSVVKTLGPPVKSRRAQDSSRRPRGESRGVNRERTKYGCT
jgi:hypothetical protein